MKNKRGQIYILAAIIMVIIIASLATTGTFASIKTTPNAITDLGSDLNKEPGEIIDYGIYSGGDINILMDDFITSDTKFAPYFLQKTDKANVVFVYGDKTNLKAVEYKEEITGTISASIGGHIGWVQSGTFAKTIQITETSPEGNIIVRVLNNDYEFKLRDNEMFYFIILQQKDGEVYIEKND